jgi:RecA/RadA recombinase
MGKKSKEIKDILGKPASTNGKHMWVPTGCDLLDIITGAGRNYGLETGEAIVFEADSQAGKTFIANEVVVAGHHFAKRNEIPYSHLYMDSEEGNNIDSSAMYGYEIMPEEEDKRIRPKTIQEAFNESVLFMRNDIKEDGFGVVVLDSLDGVIDEEIQEISEKRIQSHSRGKEMEDKTRGQGKSLYLSREFLPKVMAESADNNALYIIIAQYREKAGVYGSIKDISNGKALTFYACKRIKFRTVEKIMNKGRHIGNVIEATSKKNRGPHPYESCIFTMYFSYGVDNVGSNLDYLYDFRTATGKESKRNTTAVWDEGMEPMTKAELIAHIEDNGLEAELTQRVREKWEGERREALEPISGRRKKYG